MSSPVKIKAALCGNDLWQLERVFSQGRREFLEILADLNPTPITKANFSQRIDELKNVYLEYLK